MYVSIFNHIRKFNINKTYTILADSLEVKTKLPNQDTDVIPDSPTINTLFKGDTIKCIAVSPIDSKIWIYFGLNEKNQEQWCCAEEIVKGNRIVNVG